jgi:hypothetical protein
MKKYGRIAFLLVVVIFFPIIKGINVIVKGNWLKKLLKKVLIKGKHPTKKQNKIIETGLNKDLSLPSNPISYYLSNKSLNERKQEYLKSAKKSKGLYAQCAKVFLNRTEYNTIKIKKSIEKLNNREDTADFDMNALLRMMYLDKGKNIIPKVLKKSIKNAILDFKYWFTESGPDEMIFWTENHMILFHTAELLAGQLFQSEKFTNNNQNGTQHIQHATPLIKRWLDWKAKLGYAEWHSNIYYLLEICALVNLRDFAKDNTIAKKAEMLLDLLAFDFANNYYKGIYATAHGRTVDELQFGRGISEHPKPELLADAVWVMLGIGIYDNKSGNNSGALFLATSEYETPPILEDIAKYIAERENYIHKSRNSIKVSQGHKYGIEYKKSDLMFWWAMSAPASNPLLEHSLSLINEHSIDPKLVYNDEAFVHLFKIGAILHRTSLNEYSSLIKDLTNGVVLETANLYTYKTPYYQLSGVQDHQKGMNGLQELIWQACLDKNISIYTSSPSGLSGKKQQFTSGWKPRVTIYKNVAVIQYDRKIQTLELELVLQLLGEPSYTHAYFPRWAFNEWNRVGNWVFGRKDESYAALYSYNPIKLIESYEIRANGKKNLWIMELGSIKEFNSYKNFKNKILNATIKVNELSMGYYLIYDSPSQGEIKVSWEEPMSVDDQSIDLGPYKRFENLFCTQKFGEIKTDIIFQEKKLTLDFENAKELLK